MIQKCHAYHTERSHGLSVSTLHNYKNLSNIAVRSDDAVFAQNASETSRQHSSPELALEAWELGFRR